MNYYELLQVPPNATTDEIKRHYYKYARVYHPDKGGDPEKFKEIQEAYETLMDPIRRHQYDIDLSGTKYTFTKEDYDLIFNYYNSFIQSVEVRFMMSLFYSIPQDVRSKVTLSNLFKRSPPPPTQSTSTTLLRTNHLKYIDATQLYDSFTLHLKRSLDDVFNRVCKQIIIKTRKTYYHLYISDSDYCVKLFNDNQSMITLELTTVPNHNYYKQGYDLCYLKKIDMYEYYYGATFKLTLPNRLKVCCVATELTQKKRSFIEGFGFYDPLKQKRGRLKIMYQLTHRPMDDSAKETIKQLFHKKETFIDPSYPVYNI